MAAIEKEPQNSLLAVKQVESSSPDQSRTLISTPKPLDGAKLPIYPVGSSPSNVQVRIEALIDSVGRVVHEKVAPSSHMEADKSFQEAALIAVAQWRFKPAASMLLERDPTTGIFISRQELTAAPVDLVFTFTRSGTVNYDLVESMPQIDLKSLSVSKLRKQ